MWRTRLSECCRKPPAGWIDPLAGPAREMGPIGSQTIPQRIAVTLLWMYKTTISPLLWSACKFHPTCSEYARQAIVTHGLVQGSWLALKRLLRCRPFSPGGIDPVPELTGPKDA